MPSASSATSTVSTAFSGSGFYAGIAAVVGLIALWLFVVRQRRIEKRLIDLRPFSSAPFVIGVLMTILGLAFVFAMNVTIPLFLQGAIGMTPLGASLTLAPGILLTVVMGPVAGRLFDRHGGRWSIPLSFLAMAIFVTLVGLAAGYSPILLFGVLYIPAVLSTAFVIGPAQTFALSSLDRETSPHGVTVVATSIIGIILAFLAYRSKKPKAVQVSAPSTEIGENTVASIMKPDVYALSSEQTVLDALRTFAERGISGAPIFHADGSLAGFLSDGDVMRYLSATHPSSTSIYSYAIAIGADEGLEQAMADFADLNVMKLATHDVLTIDADSSIADAVAALSDAHIKKVPVVRGENGPIVGIASRSAINRLAITG